VVLKSRPPAVLQNQQLRKSDRKKFLQVSSREFPYQTFCGLEKVCQEEVRVEKKQIARKLCKQEKMIEGREVSGE